MTQWIEQNRVLLGWLTAASLVMFVGTLIVVPALVVRIPADYFAHARRRPSEWARGHPAVRLVALVLKNALGLVFLLAGIAMLVLPGQGLLTMLIGLLMIDFPGKYRVERWLVMRPRVLGAMNWLRRRRGRAPLVVSDERG